MTYTNLKETSMAQTATVLWDSEADDGKLGKDTDIGYTKKIGNVLVLIIDCDEVTGSRCTRLLFVGPDAEATATAKAWDDFVESNAWSDEDEEPGKLDLNCDTMKLLEKFAKAQD